MFAQKNIYNFCGHIQAMEKKVVIVRMESFPLGIIQNGDLLATIPVTRQPTIQEQNATCILQKQKQLVPF